MALQEPLTCGEGGSTGATITTRINTNHTNIGDLDILSTVDKASLVGAINEVDAAIAALVTDIDNNAIAIGVNTDAINTNITDITTNETDIATLDARVTANEADIVALQAADNIQRFEGAKVANYVVPDVYGADAVTLSATALVAGRYLISYSFSADLQANKDKVLAFQLTGDEAGFEFGLAISTTALTEKIAHNYTYYLDLPAGDISVGMVFKDVTGGLGFIVDYCDLMLQYVGPTP